MTADDAARRPRPRFRRRSEPVAGAPDPEALFGELPRTPSGVGALWSHQADQLRTYAQDHRATPDVALELPTGSGKTLVGLLIAEWRRRTLGQRVVYACPTKQLARQVLQKASAQGLHAALLVGSHRDWDQAELAQYTRGDATQALGDNHRLTLDCRDELDRLTAAACSPPPDFLNCWLRLARW